jgi:adenylylsulfate kinase
MDRQIVHPPLVVWLTGLPASGKTTLARGLAQKLKAYHLPVQVLDSDEVRKVLTPHPSYLPDERTWFYRCLVYLAELLTKNGISVILAATAHRRCFRNFARKTFKQFAEIYVRCPLRVCQDRDQKGIYALALEGKARAVPGIHEFFEVPKNPALIVDTETLSPEEGIHKIMVWLGRYYFKGDQPTQYAGDE